MTWKLVGVSVGAIRETSLNGLDTHAALQNPDAPILAREF
jgi:hypothetical protein